MKGFLGVLLVFALAVAGNARADVLQPNYLLDVEARFTVAVDGTVEDLEVEGIEDEMILGRVVQRLERWTFSMTRPEGASPGQAGPIGVTSRFQLAATSEGDSMQVRIRRPSFSTRPLGAASRAEDWQAVRRTTIHHPIGQGARRSSRGARSLDTEIVFLVEYGPDGQVLRTGVASVDLFGVEVRESERRTMELMLRPYVDEGTRGVRRWQFPVAVGEDPPAVRSVLVPVFFYTSDGPGIPKRGTWRYALSADSLVDEWARSRADRRVVAGLDHASDSLDQRIVLLATEGDLVL